MRKLLLSSVCALGIVIAISVSGCLDGPPPPTDIPMSATAPKKYTTADASGSVVATVVPTPTSAQTTPGPSAKSLAYAERIGGWDHKGQTLNLIVGGSFGTESEAQAALDKALPLFGDLQPYFIVQRSDSFAGLTPGSWVVVEAHFKTPKAEDLEFARRGFPDAHVERVRVIVSAPIPVYEDLVGGD